MPAQAPSARRFGLSGFVGGDKPRASGLMSSCVKWRGVLPDGIKTQIYIVSTSGVLPEPVSNTLHNTTRR
jgi:hypothetical protein